MRKNIKLIRTITLSFFGTAFCMLPISGCGSNNASSTEQIPEINNSASTEQIDRFDLNLPYNAYEKDYTAELEIDNQNTPIEIWSSNVGYHVVKIDGNEIPIESRDIALGGAGLELMAYDFTKDGKEEVALVESSGASGSVQYILIFSNETGKWEELSLPSDIYNDTDDPEFLEKQQKEQNIELEDSVYPKYRTISFNEEKIQINYLLYQDTDSESIEIGAIQKELSYSPDEKSFIVENTKYTPTKTTN